MDARDRSPRDHQVKLNKIKKGLIIVHTGAGKGKTTAAFGTAIRAVGSGYRVAMVQFIKGKWRSGEVEAVRKYLAGKFEIFSMGDGFTWETQNFEQDKLTAEKAWARCRELLHDETHEVVVFDEINYVLRYNMLETGRVIEELQKKPAMKHVILTGNGAPAELIEAADLVTEMRCVKHPYERGVQAQRGIEF